MKSILLKNIFDASLAALLWWSVGYAFAFGQDSFGEDGTNGFIGTSGFFYQGRGSGDDASPLTQTPFAKGHGKSLWAFNWAFAGVAATIVSGAVAERCKFLAYVCYSMAITGFIYPVVVHVAWSQDGRLSAQRSNRLTGGCGVIDFAGSGVVHVTGGIAGLVGAIIVGPREGRFIGKKALSTTYSSAFQTLGALILWFGWYGFNIGSTGGIVGSGGLASHVFFTTTIAAATGCMATTAFGYIFDKDNRKLVANANNGILAGLVSITAGCATTNVTGAFITALVASTIYHYVSSILVRLKIDDPVDAFAVHGACGAWGLIAAALGATPHYYSMAYDPERSDRCASVFFGGNPNGSLLAACYFLLFLIAWVLITTFLTFRAINAFVPGGVHMALESHANWEDMLTVDDLEACELVRLDHGIEEDVKDEDDDDEGDDDNNNVRDHRGSFLPDDTITLPSPPLQQDVKGKDEPVTGRVVTLEREFSVSSSMDGRRQEDVEMTIEPFSH